MPTDPFPSASGRGAPCPGADPGAEPEGGPRTGSQSVGGARPEAAVAGGPRRIAVAGVAVAAVVAAVVAAPSGGSSGTGSGAGPAAGSRTAGGLPYTVVEVSRGACGRGWAEPVAGVQVFGLRNAGSAATDVALVDPGTGKLHGEVEGLAAGTTRALTVDVGGGPYAFKCLREDADAVTGPTVVVPGGRPRGPGAVPVTRHDLIVPALRYQRWVADRLTALAHGTAALRADLDRGDLPAARRDWLTAHLVYARTGAAYGAFGAADGRINGTAARTAGAVRDPGFTGFHRVEYGLWHGGSAHALRAPAAALDRDVRALRRSWSQTRMDPADLGLRAHEIMEDAARAELTGRTDYGSGTNLATARANLDGTRQVLDRVRPLLAARDTALTRLDAALTRARRVLDAAHRGGTWTPPARLSPAGRRQVNAAVGGLLERLAPVAALLEVRRTA